MGFGSYDESEQERQDTPSSDIEIVTDERTHHEGHVEFSNGDDTEALVDRLQDMRDDDAENE